MVCVRPATRWKNWPTPLLLPLEWSRIRSGFDESDPSGDNRKSYIPATCGPVAQFGSALPWHGRGRRFDPDQVHQINQLLNNFNSLQLGSILAANFQRPAKTALLFPFSTATCRTGFLVLKL